MTTSRLEVFSDGVLAIIITIMVLEFEAPHEATFKALMPIIPIALSYLFSFIYVGIYWNNHHHLFQITEKVNGRILWANLLLLFCLSLIPFTTSWLGNNYEASATVILYGINLLMCAIAYFILQQQIINFHDKEFKLRLAVGKDIKGKISILMYLLGIALGLWISWLAIICYALVAILWFIPDQRIEKNI